jgi:hypothetical protein
MVVGPLEPGGASVAPLGPAEEAILLELSLVGHALRVGGASVALLSTATAPQLALDLTPNGHGPRLQDHLLALNPVGCALRVGRASVVPPGPAAARCAPDTLFLGLILIRWLVVALKARVNWSTALFSKAILGEQYCVR